MRRMLPAGKLIVDASRAATNTRLLNVPIKHPFFNVQILSLFVSCITLAKRRANGRDAW